MAYKLIWDKNSVCIDYYDQIDNNEIIDAHFAVYNDERFYDCHELIIDITKCNMDKVNPNKLTKIVGFDLGNLISRELFKIAMIAINQDNIEKAKIYITLFKNVSSKIEIFNSIEDANLWLRT
jgi:hypothetical protein